MKLKLNREFFQRHLFVALLMVGLGCWFGYDGVIGYPATPAADLYQTIEGKAAPAGFPLEKFKTQKIQTQYGFAFFAWLAAILVGGHLWSVSRFDFSFDERGFRVGTRAFLWSDIVKVDRSQWAKKSILRLSVKGLGPLKLDAWHHTGVKEFEARLSNEQTKG